TAARRRTRGWPGTIPRSVYQKTIGQSEPCGRAHTLVRRRESCYRPHRTSQEHRRPEDGNMGMRRARRACGAGAATGATRVRRGPIALDALSLVAGIAPGLELEPTVSPDGSVPGSGPVSVDEVGRLLRCSEATVRRLIRTAVLRPVGVGERWVRRSDL